MKVNKHDKFNMIIFPLAIAIGWGIFAIGFKTLW
jgi:hypothetical protein